MSKTNRIEWNGVMLKPRTIAYWDSRRCHTGRHAYKRTGQYCLNVIFLYCWVTDMLHMQSKRHSNTHAQAYSDVEIEKRARRKNENNKLFKIITFFSDPFYFHSCREMCDDTPHTNTNTNTNTNTRTCMHVYIIVWLEAPLFFVSIIVCVCIWACFD